MADIRLTAGDDTYIQPRADIDSWNHVFGEDGNDTIRLYQGIAIGGRGNDRFEQLADPDNPYRGMHVAFWDAGDNLRVNLAEGWAEDGQGGRDTLVGVTDIHGSGSRNAWVQGDAQDNHYWPNGGDDTFLGGAGQDTVSINSWFTPVAGQPARAPLLDDIDIQVAVDGRSATFKPNAGSGFQIAVTDVEFFEVQLSVGSDWTQLRVADFITPQALAEQAIVAGDAYRWNAGQALGSAVSVSYSFVTSSTQAGFRAFTPAEQQLVRDILTSTSQFTLISFTEVADGQMRFGVSAQADSKGQATLPGRDGDAAGDVWMDLESMLGIAPGSEGYQALLHEIGHALGLRHPRNVDPGDAWAGQVREQDDRLSLSVMSQVPSPDGLFRSDWGTLDVLALRHLYGSQAVNAGDTVYTLGERESRSMTSLIDDGGTDTLDASHSVTGVRLDLTPGRSSSAGVAPSGLSAVDNIGLTASSRLERAVGSAYDDVIIGSGGDNGLSGGLGNDWIEGGAGIDTASFGGRRSDYELSNAYGKVFVRARDGVGGFDTLIGIEQLSFSDQMVQLDDTPLSADSAYTLDEDARLLVSLPDPSDVARSGISYRLVDNGTHGVASIGSDGQLDYLPQANFWGSDSISYDIVAASGSNNRYVVKLQVLTVNDGAPQSSAGGYLAAGGNLIRGQLPVATDADQDPVTYALAVNSRRGDVVVNADGSFTYQARSGFVGSDAFSFIVSDGAGGSNVYSATVRVAAITSLREGTAGADTLASQPSADGYLAHAGNDRITGGPGDDVIDGGDGVDTATYTGARAGYTVASTLYGWDVKSASEGDDRLTHVERLRFRDTSLALDLDGNAGAAAQIVRAVLGPAKLSDKLVIGQALRQLDAGLSYEDLLAGAVASQSFELLAGGRSHTAIVNHLYRNVVGVLPSADELSTFVGWLDTGVFTPTSLALLAAQHPVNTHSVDLVGLAGTGIEFTP